MTDYDFEALTADSFQEFAQALLTAEHLESQCFPLGQSDAGREFVVNVDRGRRRSFVLYQVRYSQTPKAVHSPAGFARKHIQDELTKTNTQLLKGASRYIFVTNVSGVGVDKLDLQAFLDKQLPITAEVWWREDIAQRIDSKLEWAFPEILGQKDLLAALLSHPAHADDPRRMSVIRSMLTAQYQKEKDVKFKQVDLATSLLGLFVDTPFNPADPQNSAHIFFSLNSRIFATAAEDVALRRVDSNDDIGMGVGTVAFCLSTHAQALMPRVVIEGAPGQGKSTLTQYLCQIHRIRLLAMSAEIDSVRPDYLRHPLKLPLRIDLRDFASWQQRVNPFDPDPKAQLPDKWSPVLERFLAATISHLAGGLAFDETDLSAIVARSSLLLVFDGLDEVANIQARTSVVREIEEGVRRLELAALALQVIVTSRPAAFANSPGMSKDAYAYIKLSSLPRQQIRDYAQKWAAARSLEKKESFDLLRVLDKKLDLPHLRDLARNPMQLTILLSLINARGASLPDKRTALYNSYMDLFANRESEKSDIVRDHRDLIFDLHRSIAWQLHAEAEQKGTNGRISREHLEASIRDQLSRDGHRPDLVEDLFLGVVERVMALVSRVQGTYEFEVQPLREYFAACHLYETAPYSPAGRERSGTKLDRFEALVRNPYWLNVTRFYAGCYSKGELASLIDGLRALKEDGEFGLSAHPRTLAAILLSDWVFAQHPRSVREVVQLMLDESGLQHTFAAAELDRNSSAYAIADGHAREALVSQCWSMIEGKHTLDFRLTAARMILENGGRALTKDTWIERTRNATQPEQWLEIGLYLGHLGELTADEIEPLVDSSSKRQVRLLIRARRFDLLEQSSRHATAVSLVKEGVRVAIRSQPPTEEPTALMTLGQLLDISRYAVAIRGSDPRPLWLQWGNQRPQKATALVGGFKGCVQAIFDAVFTASNRVAAEWTATLAPWSDVTDVVLKQLGDCWAVKRFACLAAAIRSQVEQGAGGESPLAADTSICLRARYARLRAGNAPWWERQYSSCQDVDDEMWLLFLCFVWGSGKTLAALIPTFMERVARVTLAQWEMLYDGVRDVLASVGISPEPKAMSDLAAALTSASVIHRDAPTYIRVCSILMLRTGRETAKALFSSAIQRHMRAAEPLVAHTFLSIAIESSVDAPEWESHLELIRSLADYPNTDRFTIARLRSDAAIADKISMPYARAVCRIPSSYPAHLVALCQRRIMQNIQKGIVPLAVTARKDVWFD